MTPRPIASPPSHLRPAAAPDSAQPGIGNADLRDRGDDDVRRVDQRILDREGRCARLAAPRSAQAPRRGDSVQYRRVCS